MAMCWLPRRRDDGWDRTVQAELQYCYKLSLFEHACSDVRMKCGCAESCCCDMRAAIEQEELELSSEPSQRLLNFGFLGQSPPGETETAPKSLRSLMTAIYGPGKDMDPSCPDARTVSWRKTRRPLLRRPGAISAPPGLYSPIFPRTGHPFWRSRCEDSHRLSAAEQSGKSIKLCSFLRLLQR